MQMTGAPVMFRLRKTQNSQQLLLPAFFLFLVYVWYVHCYCFEILPHVFPLCKITSFSSSLLELIIRTGSCAENRACPDETVVGAEYLMEALYALPLQPSP